MEFVGKNNILRSLRSSPSDTYVRGAVVIKGSEIDSFPRPQPIQRIGSYRSRKLGKKWSAPLLLTSSRYCAPSYS